MKYLRTGVSDCADMRIVRSRAALQPLPRNIQLDPKILRTPQTKKIPDAANFALQRLEATDFVINKLIRVRRPANFPQNGPNTVNTKSGSNAFEIFVSRSRAALPARM